MLLLLQARNHSDLDNGKVHFFQTKLYYLNYYFSNAEDQLICGLKSSIFPTTQIKYLILVFGESVCKER